MDSLQIEKNVKILSPARAASIILYKTQNKLSKIRITFQKCLLRHQAILERSFSPSNAHIVALLYTKKEDAHMFNALNAKDNFVGTA